MSRMLLSLLCFATVAAAEPYTYRDGEASGAGEAPARLVSPVPFDKRYEQLNEAERTALRSRQTLPAECEPPFPLEGWRPLFEQLTRYQARSGIDVAGQMAFTLQVDQAGTVTDVTIQRSPSERLNRMASQLLRDVPFKPARCKGEASAMAYKLDFELLAPPNRVERD
ncbi:energy transducer TonB [Chitinimonas lacunae]|uniref:Energy transducer TonB n=1 Tax=Chitinimonas lacunae TaxID=1963018 RepID=A0ABV8MW87_9NEIS